MLDPLFNQVVGLQVCNFIKKRFQHGCFSLNIAKFLKTHILKKICERLLLNSVEPNFSSVYLKRCSYKFFSMLFVRRYLCQSVLFIKIQLQAYNLSLSLFKKRFRHWYFSWQVYDIFNNNFFKNNWYKKKALL